jgi:hypothetical protein
MSEKEHGFVPKEIWRLRRIQKPVTLKEGRLFSVNHCRIEIDITYKCNLKCINCDRSCRQAPSHEAMSLEQIRKFIDESIRGRRKWERIRILGGEPTLHPEFLPITELLLLYRKNFSPDTVIQVATNGRGATVNNALSRVSKEIVIINTCKKSPVNKFSPINVAPKDCIMYKDVDYSNGCFIPSLCGIGLTRYGYYPCAAGGAIDRVFGFDIGKKNLPVVNQPMINELKILCGYCGHFKSNIKYERITKEMMSTSWKIAYRKYKKRKPALSLY